MFDFSCSTLELPRGRCDQNSGVGSESNLATQKSIKHYHLFTDSLHFIFEGNDPGSRNTLRVQQSGKCKGGGKKPRISKDLKTELCSLRTAGSKKTRFVASGEEKKRAPQGNYQQMVNTFLILLSYCVDLYTFVLLC